LLRPRSENEIPEYAGRYGVSGACRAQDCRKVSGYFAINSIHLLYRRPGGDALPHFVGSLMEQQSRQAFVTGWAPTTERIVSEGS